MKKKNHQNIVLFYGVCQKPLCVITEFCSKGSLQKLLANQEFEMTQERKIKFIKEIANGMNYLITENIIHKDLNSGNVLITEEFVCKIADYGLSKFLNQVILPSNSSNTLTNKTLSNPSKWMSPEAFHNREFSEKSDVWSFGIVSIEILTRSLPFPNLSARDFLKSYNDEVSKVNTQIPQNIPANLSKLLKACLETETKDRPTFEGICTRLQ